MARFLGRRCAPARMVARRRFLEQLESRQLLAGDVAPIDGVGNNLVHPDWGSVGEQFLRTTFADYADNASAPAGGDRPSARAISNAVNDQAADAPSERNLSSFVFQWGQFLDHDLDLSGTASPAEAFPIAVPQGDPEFDPTGTGTQVIPLSRTVYDLATGTTSPREQVNSITAYIDGSMVYGSDAARADALREHAGGRLRTSAGNLLPFNTTGLPNAAFGDPADSFVAGDIRVNEQVGLIAIQTLFVREHNRIAGELAARNPTWSDEQLYQAARKWVVAEIQAITYNEFLPAVLGPNAPQTYRGYDPNVNVGVSNEFATAAFRVGHTMLPGEMLRLDASGAEIAAGGLSLRDAFFNVDAVTAEGVEPILRGLAGQTQQEIDHQVIDDVRNFLFGPPGAGGLDLASLNIQRGRDHGLASYNETRIALGLPAATRFADISSDPDVQARLASAYATVDDVDLWVGGISEDHLAGSSLGATFTRIWSDQFERSRSGDRFWFENSFRGRELEQLRNLRLSDVLKANGVSGELQPNVFFTRETLAFRGAADRPLNVTLRASGGGEPRVELFDNAARRVIVSRPLAEVERVVVWGGSAGDIINVDASLTLPVEVLGGAGDDALNVQGGAGRDVIDISFRNLTRPGVGEVAYGRFERLNVFGGGGDDRLVVQGASEARVALFGQAGADTLIGGERGDILSGGEGNDILEGRGGRDLLFGGAGRDLLEGGEGEDVLVGMATPYDQDLAALDAMFSLWVGPGSRTQRANALTNGPLNPRRLPPSREGDLLGRPDPADLIVRGP